MSQLSVVSFNHAIFAERVYGFIHLIFICGDRVVCSTVNKTVTKWYSHSNESNPNFIIQSSNMSLFGPHFGSVTEMNILERL